MKLLESTTLFRKTLLNSVDLDVSLEGENDCNIVFSEDRRSRFIHVEIKSTKVSIFMRHFVSRHLFDFNVFSWWYNSYSYIDYLSKQYNTFSIVKYAKTVNYWSPYSLADGSFESRTPC